MLKQRFGWFVWLLVYIRQVKFLMKSDVSRSNSLFIWKLIHPYQISSERTLQHKGGYFLLCTYVSQTQLSITVLNSPQCVCLFFYFCHVIFILKNVKTLELFLKKLHQLTLSWCLDKVEGGRLNKTLCGTKPQYRHSHSIVAAVENYWMSSMSNLFDIVFFCENGLIDT